MKRLFAALLLLVTAAAPAFAETGWTVVRSYPHDSHAFTEGLFYHDGLMWESTGMVGQSEIRAVRLEDGKVVRRVTVPAPYFGEGIAHWKDHLISLTWQHGRGFIWSFPGLKQTGRFAYKGEGWGLTSDGTRLIMSDGTPSLRFLDPETLRETGRLRVTWNGQPVAMLNELEWMDGEILANVWMTPKIARIDPVTGKVKDWIDLSDLVAKVPTRTVDDVLNGIAWDAKGRRLFVTGKNWPEIFEIKLQR
jgi:glutamine cyclotransferase